jgi:hypothetical protein
MGLHWRGNIAKNHARVSLKLFPSHLHVEKDKRFKFDDPKMERCVNLGPSTNHPHTTFHHSNLRNMRDTCRRSAVSNEQSYPLRPDNKIQRPPHTEPTVAHLDSGHDLIRKTFRLEGKKKGAMYTAISIGKFKGLMGVDYIDRKGEECTSATPEARSWWVNTHELQNASTASRLPLMSKVTKWNNSNGQTTTNQPINSRFAPGGSPSAAEKPTTMNRLASESYKQIMRKRTRDALCGEEVPRNMRDTGKWTVRGFNRKTKKQEARLILKHGNE